MGIFKKFIKSQFIEVIEWTESNLDRMVYRFPVEDNEIKMGAQLTVRASQVAVFVNEGQIADVFTPGKHTLTTENMPILTKLKSWKYGFNSPFKAEVYFVSTKQFTNMKWGTMNPIMMRDQEFGRIRIRALGTYAFKVANAGVFLKEIFGTSGDFRTDTVKDHLRGIVVGSLSDLFAESNIAAMDFNANLDELAERGMNKLQDNFSAMGFEITQFVIENISLPEEVMLAMDERNKMNMLGVDNYATYKTLDAVEKAASNPSGGMAGAGVGMGAGAALGNIMAQAMNPSSTSNQQVAQASDDITCSKCQQSMSKDSKFCPSCGQATSITKPCVKCGVPLKEGSKFCMECGEKQEKTCPSCQTAVTGAFCSNCGTKVD